MSQIFYLEDNDDIRETMSHILVLELPDSYEVRSFCTLSALRSAISCQTPALVISDLNVPDGDAESVLRALRTDLPDSIPVILSSGDMPALRRLEGNTRFDLYPKGERTEVLFKLLDKYIARAAQSVRRLASPVA